eukprot:1101893_1
MTLPRRHQAGTLSNNLLPILAVSIIALGLDVRLVGLGRSALVSSVSSPWAGHVGNQSFFSHWKTIGAEKRDAPEMSSPACKPHFRLALPDGNWTNATKFKRLYFYHARKAGGTNLRKYFEKVAAHHGLQYKVTEYDMAEDPGSHDEATFYVTHLREPVSRSISHFKYQGRWECKQLVTNASFVPTEENARKIESWNQHFGHDPSSR